MKNAYLPDVLDFKVENDLSELAELLERLQNPTPDNDLLENAFRGINARRQVNGSVLYSDVDVDAVECDLACQNDSMVGMMNWDSASSHATDDIVLDNVSLNSQVLHHYCSRDAQVDGVETWEQYEYLPSSYHHLNGAILTREEYIGRFEQYDYFPYGGNGFQQIMGLASQASTIPYPYGNFGYDASWNQEIYIQGEHGFDSSETSFLACDDGSEDVGSSENEPFRVVEDAGQSLIERTYQQQWASMNNIECLTTGPPSESIEILKILSVEVSDNMHGCNYGYQPKTALKQEVCPIPCPTTYSGTDAITCVSFDIPQIWTVEGYEEPDEVQDNNNTIDLLSRLKNPIIPLHQGRDLVENRLQQGCNPIEQNGEVTSANARVIADDIRQRHMDR